MKKRSKDEFGQDWTDWLGLIILMSPLSMIIYSLYFMK